MRRPHFLDFVEWLGKTIPGDNEEWLVCGRNGVKWEHGRWPWTYESHDEEGEGVGPLFPEACPVCGHELHVHVPRGFRWQLRCQMLAMRYFPYRLYGGGLFGGEDPYMTWNWRNRVLLTRPRQSK